MQATKSATPAPARPASVALDFLMLAGASIIAGLLTAAVAALFVIALGGQADAAPDSAQGAAPASAATDVSANSPKH